MDSLNLEHGECPTCGRCRCCGQSGFTFSNLNLNLDHIPTTVVIPTTEATIEFDQLNKADKLMELIKSVRCDSSFPVSQETVEDIINEQTN